MKKLLTALAALCTFAGTAYAADNAPRDFKPAGPWAVDYGDDYCRLARDFSDGNSQLSLAFERIQPSNALRIVMMGGDLKMFRGAKELGVTLAPSGGERKGAYWLGKTPDGKDYYNLGEVIMGPPIVFDPKAAPPEPGKPMAIPPYDRAAEQKYADGITAIDLGTGMIDPVHVETGNLKGPVAALQKCSDDLLASWGVDAAKHQSMTRPAQPSTPANGWLPNGTIGFADFAKLGGASNQIRVMVSADGKPTKCAVHWASLEQKTNDAICKAIMDKAQFFPALDASGQPMASYWTVQPFFLMPPFGKR